MWLRNARGSPWESETHLHSTSPGMECLTDSGNVPQRHLRLLFLPCTHLHWLRGAGIQMGSHGETHVLPGGSRRCAPLEGSQERPAASAFSASDSAGHESSGLPPLVMESTIQQPLACSHKRAQSPREGGGGVSD